MDHFVLRSRSYDQLKHEAREVFPDVQSAHLTEAVARGIGFGSHAALRTALRQRSYLAQATPFDLRLFARALTDFGYEPVSEFANKKWTWSTVLLWAVIFELCLEGAAEPGVSSTSTHRNPAKPLLSQAPKGGSPTQLVVREEIVAMRLRRALSDDARDCEDLGDAVGSVLPELRRLMQVNVLHNTGDRWASLPPLMMLDCREGTIFMELNGRVLPLMIRHQNPILRP